MHDKAMTTRLWIAILLLAAVTWLGCPPKKQTVSDIKPAVVSFVRAPTLALLRFDGLYGETVRSHVYDKLAEVKHFRAIDASLVHGLNNVMYDQVDDPRLLPAIETLRADAVLAGRVTASIHDIRATDQVEMKEGTGHYKRGKNLSGQWVDVEIKRTVVRPVPCIIRRARVATEYKVFDLKTKRVIDIGDLKEVYDEKFGGDRERASCGHKLSDLPPPDVTMDEICARLAAELVAKICRIKRHNN